MQVQVLLSFEYCPAGHFVQTAEPAAEYHPGSQSISLTLPAGHLVPQTHFVAVQVPSVAQ